MKDHAAGDRACIDGRITIGVVPVKASFLFRANGLTEVLLDFKPDRFPDIAGAFRERYGEPTESREEVQRTRAGLEIVNLIHDWRGERMMTSSHLVPMKTPIRWGRLLGQ